MLLSTDACCGTAHGHSCAMTAQDLPNLEGTPTRRSIPPPAHRPHAERWPSRRLAIHSGRRTRYGVSMVAIGAIRPGGHRIAAAPPTGDWRKATTSRGFFREGHEEPPIFPPRWHIPPPCRGGRSWWRFPWRTPPRRARVEPDPGSPHDPDRSPTVIPPKARCRSWAAIECRTARRATLN